MTYVRGHVTSDQFTSSETGAIRLEGGGNLRFNIFNISDQRQNDNKSNHY